MPVVTLNDKELELPSSCSLAELLSSVGAPEAGTAIAVNEKVISKANWKSFKLQGGESILLITAAQGG